MAHPALPARERRALNALALEAPPALSAISLWEVQMLHARKRITLPLPFEQWLLAAADSRTVALLPLDVAVVSSLNALSGNFHGDPADRLIVATARAHGLPIATHDSLIRRSRLVPLWKS